MSLLVPGFPPEPVMAATPAPANMAPNTGATENSSGRRSRAAEDHRGGVAAADAIRQATGERGSHRRQQSGDRANGSRTGFG